MAARKLAEVNRLYCFKAPDELDDNLRKRLPEAYKKFYREWKMTVPSPVHWRPNPAKWERNVQTGEVKPVQNVPILPKFPPQSDRGLWGGEGVVHGYIKRAGRYAAKTPHFWFPLLKRSVIYSEILDKYMSAVVTTRTINLILDNHGLDHYILKTKACDIQSDLGVKLKRKMLLVLLNKDLYNDDLVKQEEVYNKYRHYLDGYTKEEIEWYGLSMYEALLKYENEIEMKKPEPLKHVLRQQLVEQLKLELIEKIEAEKSFAESNSSSKSSWISKINPFGGSTKK